MTEEVFKWWFVIGPVCGFAMGGALVGILLLFMKKKMLDLPNPICSAEGIREYLEKDKEIKEINRITKQVLDNIRING